MRILLSFVICVFVVSSCCNSGSEPGPPYGAADNVSRYDGGSGYKSVDYTYYCYRGKYVSVTYVRADECSDYVKDSEFTSDGICSSAIEGSMSLDDKSVSEQLILLQKNGFKIDTLLINGAEL